MIRNMMILLGVTLVINLSLAGVAVGQDKTAAKTKQEADRQDTDKRDVAKIYEKTKTAKTAKEFTEIIELAGAKLDNPSLTDHHRKYLKTLLGWAHDQRATTRVDVIEFLKSANNQEQAAIALDKAEQDFEMALKLAPERWQIYLHRGVMYSLNDLQQQAIDDFTTILDSQPKQINVWFNRAEVFYEMGEYEKALADYAAVLEHSPGDLQAITGKAHSLLALGRTEEALVEYNVVVRIKPNQPWPLANRADALQRMNDWAGAYRDYTKALEIAQVPDIYRRIAWMLATCPEQEYYQPQMAVELAKKALAMGGSETASRLETLAAALASCGDFDEAKKNQEKAIQIATESKESMQKRMALYEAGEAFLQPKVER